MASQPRPVALVCYPTITFLLLAVTTACLVPAPERAGSADPRGVSGPRSGPPGVVERRLVEQLLLGLDFGHGRVRVVPGALPELAATEAERALATAAELLEHGRVLEALELAATAIRALPDRPLAHHLLARALRYRERPDLAEAAYRTALDLDPAHIESRYELAIVLQADGRLDEAGAEWQRVLDDDPDHGPSHARLAALSFLIGDLAACEQHRLEAQRLGARLPSALAGACEVQPAAIHSRGASVLPVALPPTRVDAGSGSAHAAETILAAGAGQQMVAGWIDLREGGNNGPWKVGVGTTLDGGATWADQVLHGPFSVAGDYEGDPMVAHDPRTGNQWVGGILFGYVNQMPSRLWIARRQPGTNSFLAPVQIHTASFVDKALLVAGPRPGLPNTTRLYVTYNLGIHRSDDLGATWSPLQSLPSGLGYQPRLGANGVLYVLYWDLGFEFELVKSTDGGVTFGPPVSVATRLDTWGPEENNPRFPGGFRVAPLAYLAVDPTTGALTAVYPDTTSVAGGEYDVDLYLTRSTNGGATWSPPVVLGGDSTPPRDQFHPWLEADSTGKLHLAFFDTRDTPQLDADSNAWIDLYYATSDDGGGTWAELRVTDSPFQSALAPFSGFQSQFVGDYLALGSVGDPQAGAQIHLLYPSTADGHLHVYAQILDYQAIFADGFESGDTAAWSEVVP